MSTPTRSSVLRSRITPTSMWTNATCKTNRAGALRARPIVRGAPFSDTAAFHRTGPQRASVRGHAFSHGRGADARVRGDGADQPRPWLALHDRGLRRRRRGGLERVVPSGAGGRAGGLGRRRGDRGTHRYPKAI